MNGLYFNTWKIYYINGCDKNLNTILSYQLINVTRHVFKITIHDLSIYDLYQFLGMFNLLIYILTFEKKTMEAKK
jgi:hypothetical protein